MVQLKFVDLFCGLGGFHEALSRLGHKCVLASDINTKLRETYLLNFGIEPVGDLRSIHESKIPSHDVLCAGFPCQPFSKAGEQLGTDCKLWGDLFEAHVLRILKKHKPNFFIFENVANLERHDGGLTWLRMRKKLEEDCDYAVDSKILSPHEFGVPQIRNRLFIVGCLKGLDHFSWPMPTEGEPKIQSILDRNPKDAKPITNQVERCLNVWNEFIQLAPRDEQLPSFPIWTMEFGATYPYTKYSSLEKTTVKSLRNHRGALGRSLAVKTRRELEQRLPSYARGTGEVFPPWKQNFIRQNRAYYKQNKTWIKPWLNQIKEFPPSLQKFEWNCKGEERDIWKFVIQFRASGVRVKRPTTAPSLVAMTTTQVPIIAWEKRYMTPLECCRLQSLEGLKHLPSSQTGVVRALGNAVNAKVVESIARSLFSVSSKQKRKAG